MNIFIEIFKNKVVYAGFITVFTAQLIKVSIYIYRDRRFKLSYLIAMGGLPSYI